MPVKRLVHSMSGFLRSMQMSSTRFWLFVEGDVDRTFYSGIVERSRVADTSYEFVSARELHPPGPGAGGKQVLLSFFRYLRDRSNLRSTLCAKETVARFLLDKDLDDMERRRVRSHHVVYTDYYCIENYIYRNSDLTRAVGAVAQVDLARAARSVGTRNDAWTRACVVHWREWVEFCRLARVLRVKRIGTFGCERSPFHRDARGPVDRTQRAALINAARSSCGLPKSDFDARFKICKRYVAHLLRTDMYDRLWNGKWYGVFPVVDAEATRGRKFGSPRQAREKLEACLLAMLDYSGPWADALVAKVNSFVESEA